MDKRAIQRFRVADDWFGKPEEERFSFIVESMDNIMGKIHDINLGGIGFEIQGLNEERMQLFLGSEELFIRLQLGNESIVTEVRIAWHSSSQAEGGVNVLGGFIIDIISPGDRLNLHEFIERTRDSVFR